MYLSKEISISDNDVYVLAQSQNYFVINYNYEGIKIYNYDLQYIDSLVFKNEIVVYQIFSTLLNDKIVISDVENEKLFIIDLNNKVKNIVETNRDEIFLEHFIVHDNYFSVRDSEYVYNISFTDGNEISRNNYQYANILANNQLEQIYEAEGELFYVKDFKQEKLNVGYVFDRFYSVCNGIILEYGGREIIVRDLSNVIKKIEIDKRWEIRKAIIREKSFLILLNSKESIYNSKIQRYVL